MKIIVLDGHALNPGDLSWSEMSQLGKLLVLPRTPFEVLAETIAEAEAVITNKAPITAEIIHSCPNLKYIGVTATGYNIVDLKAATKKGIVVTNAPGYSTNSVAQHTIALILELLNNVGLHNHRVKKNAWSQQPDFSLALRPIAELASKNMGIIGMGAIGTKVAEIAAAFGMKVRFTNRSKKPDLPYDQVVLDELLQTSDVLSLHLPLTPASEKMIGTRALEMMKSTALLINTARGQLVDELALIEALEKGKIAAAGLDVLSLEPPAVDHPLFGLPNCLITPHISWAAVEARQTLMNITVANLKAFLSGKPQNVVSDL